MESSVLTVETTISWNGQQHTIKTRLEPIFSDEFESSLAEALDRNKFALTLLSRFDAGK